MSAAETGTHADPESTEVAESPAAPEALPQKKPRKPDRRRALTRRAIVDAAAALFAAEGTDVTTVDEIAEAAGMSVGTLYFHFGSKEGVELALVREVLERTDELLAAARQQGTPLQRLERAGDLYLRFAFEQPVAFRLVSTGLPAAAADASPEIEVSRTEITHRMKGFVDAVREDIAAAMAQGELAAADPDAAFTFLWGAWNGVVGLTLREDDFAVTREQADAALALGRALLMRPLGGREA